MPVLLPAPSQGAEDDYTTEYTIENEVQMVIVDRAAQVVRIVFASGQVVAVRFHEFLYLTLDLRDEQIF